MTSANMTNTEALAKSHALEFADHGGGHVQIKGHGVLVNYWPDSKNRTAYVVGGPTVKHCNPYDAIRLCLTSGKTTLKPKAKPSNRGPDFDVRPHHANPAGIKHFYDGDKPPWEYPAMIRCESDNIRIRAMHLRDEADAMDALQ